ncbi:MAG: flagellar assembly protein FliW [Bacillota bacterium]
MDVHANKEDITVKEIQKVLFPWGMPGLEYEEYILTSAGPESPFYFLESTKQPEVGLLLINPFVAFNDYEFDIGEEVARQLKICDEKQVAVFCTVNTSRGIESATVNLLAPIVINTEGLIGKQIVLNDKKFSMRTPLAIARGKKEKGR